MSLASERALLSVSLRSPDVIDEARSMGLRPDHFGSLQLRAIWEFVAGRRERGAIPDMALVYDGLGPLPGSERPQSAAFDSFTSLDTTVRGLEVCPSRAGAVPGYVEEIRKSAQARAAVHHAQRVLAMHKEGSSAEDIIAASAEAYTAVCSATGGAKSTHTRTHELLEGYLQRRLEERLDPTKDSEGRLLSGMGALDRFLGMRRGQMIVVAGRPKMGKSALAATLGRNLARRYGPVLFVSAEMGAEDTAERTCSATMNLDISGIDAFRTGADKVLAEWKDTDLYYDFGPQSVDQAVRSIRVAHARLGICAAVVDYLQLLRMADGANREQEVAKASLAMKSLAKELNIVMIVVAQLSRKCEARTDKRPMASDLRDSGQIEQDLDALVMVYRDCIYNDKAEEDKAELLIRLQRNGGIGAAMVHWKPGSGWFADIDTAKQVATRAAYSPDPDQEKWD